MSHMLNFCHLKKIDFSPFNTTNVINMNGLLTLCDNLIYLD